MSKVMGYKTPIYYGAKGTTAATVITNAVDVTYDVGTETGSTTKRGDGSVIPIVTGEATAITPTLTFNMIVDTTDTTLTALVAAAKTGLAVALKYDTFDCDCILDVKNGAPLKGEKTFDFSVKAVSNSDREPIL